MATMYAKTKPAAEWNNVGTQPQGTSLAHKNLTLGRSILHHIDYIFAQWYIYGGKI